MASIKYTTRKARYTNKVTKGKAIITGVTNKAHATALLGYVCNHYGWQPQHVSIKYTSVTRFNHIS